MVQINAKYINNSLSDSCRSRGIKETPGSVTLLQRDWLAPEHPPLAEAQRAQGGDEPAQEQR